MSDAPPPELTFVECSPDSPEASGLLDALSGELLERFASDGRSSFDGWRSDDPLHIFVVAKWGGEAVGCGAVRPIGRGVGEVKRMFAKYRRRGIGAGVLRELERRARARDYRWLWLETRTSNEEAVAFYLSQSYRVRDNFGRYAGNPAAICFEKWLKE